MTKEEAEDEEDEEDAAFALALAHKLTNPTSYNISFPPECPGTISNMARRSVT